MSRTLRSATQLSSWDSDDARGPPVVQSVGPCIPPPCTPRVGSSASPSRPGRPCWAGPHLPRGLGSRDPAEGAVAGCVCLSQWLSPPGGACPRFPPGLPFWGTAGPRASPTLAGRVADRRPQARVHCPEVRGPRATAVGLPRPFLLRELTLGDTCFPTPALLPHVSWGGSWVATGGAGEPPLGPQPEPILLHSGTWCVASPGTHHPVLAAPGLVPRPAK